MDEVFELKESETIWKNQKQWKIHLGPILLISRKLTVAIEHLFNQLKFQPNGYNTFYLNNILGLVLYLSSDAEHFNHQIIHVIQKHFRRNVEKNY